MSRSEKNELIMNFMGYKLDHMKFTKDYKYGSFNTSSAKYDTDWNWIMPVVQKIATIEVDYEPLSNVSLYSPIELIYDEVVKFIQSHNIPIV